MGIKIPARLREALSGTPVEAPALTFAAEAESVLRAGITPFFPELDNGVGHLERVLVTSAKLIPDEAWDQGILSAADVSALLGAVILPILAVHIGETAFLELISPTSRFEPLSLFLDERSGRTSDIPWHQIWATHLRAPPQRRDYLSALRPSGLDPAAWTEEDHHLIGEFIHRHRSRLAQEIAVYGLPGTSTSDVSLSSALPNLAVIIGGIARAQGDPPDDWAAHFDYLAPGNLRPSGVVAPYLTAVLRIANLLQIDSSSPFFLLDLPPHLDLELPRAWGPAPIAQVSWDHSDSEAIFIEIAPGTPQATHLSLVRYVETLRRELSSATVMLTRTYSKTRFAPLELTRYRVHTNDDSLQSRPSHWTTIREFNINDWSSKRAFISYVHEDGPQVDRVQRFLEANGVRTWRDKDRLWPGEDWQLKIREAITNGALVFIACFSDNSARRDTSYQNEELVLAVEQFRRRPPGRPWLIPVRFSDCELPPFDLGAGRTLNSLQRVDLYADRWGTGLDRLLYTISVAGRL